jgi:hypothetical protein
MQIIVNHLTRMQDGYICVAGVEMTTGKHIRPVVQHRMPRTLLLRQGGPFDIGAVVELGPTIPVGKPPSMEDYSFNPKYAHRICDATPNFFWRLLERVARDSLAAIFGAGLERHGRTFVVAAHTGSASLGVLRPAMLAFDRDPASGKLRLRLSDGGEPVSLSVTDLRLYEADQQTPRWAMVEDLTARLQQGTPALVSLGLTRPYRALGDTAHLHYLQANNIHLADYPLRQEHAQPE